MTNLLKIGLALMLLLIVADAGLAADWPEWRGKGRLAVWNEEGILDQIPEDGLKTSWRVPIGSGYSGPVVSRGRVVTMDYLPKPDTETAEAIERVICLDEQSGKLLWKDEWQTHYRELMGSYRTGPRATPTTIRHPRAPRAARHRGWRRRGGCGRSWRSREPRPRWWARTRSRCSTAPW